MTFAMLGYGRFGQAFSGLLQQAGHEVCVFDPGAAAPAALARPTLETVVDGAEWVVLAMPVPFMRDALHALRPQLHRDQIVFDVGSVKLHPCEAMDAVLGTAIAHVGTHPLFGPLSLARGDRPLRSVVCPSARHPEAAVRVSALLRELGCEVFEQDPATHDRAMARTHALAFFVAKGLVELGVGEGEGMALAPPSFQGMRNMIDAVRGDAGHLFAAIQRENPYSAEARADLLDALEQVHRQLEQPDDDDRLAIPERPA